MKKKLIVFFTIIFISVNISNDNVLIANNTNFDNDTEIVNAMTNKILMVTMREDPSYESPMITDIPPDTPIKLISYSTGGYIKAIYNGEVGYIYYTGLVMTDEVKKLLSGSKLISLRENIEYDPSVENIESNDQDYSSSSNQDYSSSSNQDYSSSSNMQTNLSMYNIKTIKILVVVALIFGIVFLLVIKMKARKQPTLSIIFYILSGLSLIGGIFLTYKFWPGYPGAGYEWKAKAYTLSIIWLMAGIIQAAIYIAIGQTIFYLKEIMINTSNE